MAVIELALPAVAFPGGQTLSRLAARFSAWKAARATRTALTHLSDRELEDIGLSRGDIYRASIGH